MTKLLRHWHWKLASLAIATLLWLATVGEPENATSLSVPVYYRNAPKDLEISSEMLDRVRLEVRGPSSKLRQQQLADAAIMVDLGAIKRPGEQTFPLDDSTATLPPGVSVLSAVPPQVRLRFEHRATREVPVQVRTATRPPRGFELISVKPTPERIWITGPESKVSEVSAAETDAIDLSSLSESGDLVTHVTIADPQVRLRNGSKVTVHVELRKL